MRPQTIFHQRRKHTGSGLLQLEARSPHSPPPTPRNIWPPLILIPAYTPLRRRIKLIRYDSRELKPGQKDQSLICRTALVPQSIEYLRLQDLQDHTDTVVSCIKFCMDTVTADKHICVLSKREAMDDMWSSASNSAFRAEDKTLHTASYFHTAINSQGP